MREMSGPARGTALIAGMEREAKQRAKPEVRASRMVAVWKGLEAEHNRDESWQKAPVREAIAEQMKGVAQVIHQDRPARAVMAAQPARFGITPGSLLMQIVQGRSLSQIAGRVLSQSISADLDIGRSRERGHDLGMSM
jgi:hypothetical protein